MEPARAGLLLTGSRVAGNHRARDLLSFGKRQRQPGAVSLCWLYSAWFRKNPLYRRVVPIGQAGNLMKHFTFLPVLPHQSSLGFRVVDPPSLFLVQHPAHTDLSVLHRPVESTTHHCRSLFRDGRPFRPRTGPPGSACGRSGKRPQAVVQSEGGDRLFSGHFGLSHLLRRSAA